jgi:hypothetical protein
MFASFMVRRHLSGAVHRLASLRHQSRQAPSSAPLSFSGFGLTQTPLSDSFENFFVRASLSYPNDS